MHRLQQPIGNTGTTSMGTIILALTTIILFLATIRLQLLLFGQQEQIFQLGSALPMPHSGIKACHQTTDFSCESVQRLHGGLCDIGLIRIFQW